MIKILDSTLREGELLPGLYFSRKSRIRIAEALAEVGTSRIELPLVYPQRRGKTEDIKSVVSTVQESYGKTAVLQFRAYKPDVELSQGYDAKGCALFMAPTYLHRIGKLHGLKRQQVIDIFVETLELARSYGYTYRRAVLEDISRFDNPQERTKEDSYNFLGSILYAVKEAGATIVSIPDTSGILPPSRCVPFIQKITKLTDLPLACHFHNDYGNALANALQAVTIPKVEEIHVTILGIGARNGITDHYKFIANLEDLLHIPSGEKREKIRWLYQIFSENTGIPIPWAHPLAPQCFVEKAGTHQSQAIKHPSGYIPRKKLEYDSFSVEVLYEAGQLMSKKVVERLFQIAARDLPHDFEPSPGLIKEITETIAARSTLKQREVSPWEVKEIIQLKTSVDIPIEKIQQVIKGGDYAYIMLKLLPKFRASELIREVITWKEVERIDETYGDIDAIIFTQLKDANGVDVTDKLRNRFKHVILKTTTLPIE